MDPNSFNFPYAPYPIQCDFMNSLYQCIEEKKIGLFESPTGTGKTLSLICGTMKWLRDHQNEPLILEKVENSKFKQTNSNTSKFKWENEFFSKEKRDLELNTIKEYKKFYASLDKKLQELRENEHLSFTNPAKQFRIEDSVSLELSTTSKESEFLLDYDSDSDSKLFENTNTSMGYTKSFKAQDFTCRKIFLCSRTHTQINQIIREYNRTAWSKKGRVVILGSRKLMCLNPLVNKLPTNSQINDKCLELIPSSQIDQILSSEKCLNFLAKIVPKSKCPFFQKTNIENFSNNILAWPKDIEDLVSDGNMLMACPYYATRSAIASAELVILPYHSLLHDQVRQSLGIDLRGHVVIFDEAHNLRETINAIYSTEVTLLKISQGLAQIEQYLDKYKDLMNLKNVSFIEKLVYVLRALIKVLKPSNGDAPKNKPKERSSEVELKGDDFDKDVPCKNSMNHFKTMIPARAVNSNAMELQQNSTKMKTPKLCDSFLENSRQFNNFFTNITNPNIQQRLVKSNEFLFDCNLDNMNLFQLNRFITKSNLINKVQGFCNSTQIEIRKMSSNESLIIDVSKDEFEKHRPALSSINQFLMSLTNLDSDGRILINLDPDPSKSFIRYVLLNPEIYFQPILNDAHSVVMVGGTMQPFEDFKNYLINSKVTNTNPDNEVELKEVMTFSCSHIIPDSNLITVIFKSGPTGLPLTFNYEKRLTLENQLEAGRILLNLSNVIPDGIVVFFPSYYYEEQVWRIWESNGIVGSIKEHKVIFRESREACDVELMFKEYVDTIHKKVLKGAVLICIIGGKLSEGINFKDELGRGVVVFGLPYPNTKDLILQEKISFVKRRAMKEGKEMADINRVASEYIENICMRTLNQSIGRSIRHVNDYAVIILVDERYQRQNIQKKLPNWISQTTRIYDSFGVALRNIAKFFLSKK